MMPKGYKCLSPQGRVYISRHVIFDDFNFPYYALFPPETTEMFLFLHKYFQLIYYHHTTLKFCPLLIKIKGMFLHLFWINQNHLYLQSTYYLHFLLLLTFLFLPLFKILANQIHIQILFSDIHQLLHKLLLSFLTHHTQIIVLTPYMP